MSEIRLKAHIIFVSQCALCIAAVVLLTLNSTLVASAVGSDEAIDALEEADTALCSSFVALVKAEGAGANVTVLVGKLNVAGDYLSEGYVALRGENYEIAVQMAVACSNAVEGVSNEAAYLKLDVEQVHGDRDFLTAIGSAVGLVLLFVLGFLGWGFVKRSYSKRILGLKPVVGEN